MQNAEQQASTLSKIWSNTMAINDMISNSIRKYFASEDTYLYNNYFNTFTNIIHKTGFYLAAVGLVIACADLFTLQGATISVLLSLTGLGALIYPALIFGPIVLGIALQIVACMIYNFTARLHQLIHFSKYQTITQAEILCKMQETRIQTIQRTLAILKTGKQSRQNATYIANLQKELSELSNNLTHNTPSTVKCRVLQACIQDAVSEYLIDNTELTKDAIQKLKTLVTNAHPETISTAIQTLATQHPELHTAYLQKIDKSIYFKNATATVTNFLNSITLERDFNSATALKNNIIPHLENTIPISKNEGFEKYVQELIATKSPRLIDSILPESLKNYEDFKKKKEITAYIEATKTAKKPKGFFYSSKFANIALFTYKLLDMLTFGILTFSVGTTHYLLQKAGITPDNISLGKVKTLPSIVNKETIDQFKKVTQLATLENNNNQNDLHEFIHTMETAQQEGNKLVKFLEKQASRNNEISQLEQANHRLDLTSLYIYYKKKNHVSTTISKISSAMEKLARYQKLRAMGDNLAHLLTNDTTNKQLKSLVGEYYTLSSAYELQSLLKEHKKTNNKTHKEYLQQRIRHLKGTDGYKKQMHAIGQQPKTSLLKENTTEAQNNFIIKSSALLEKLPSDERKNLRALVASLRQYNHVERKKLKNQLADLAEIASDDSELQHLKMLYQTLASEYSLLPLAQYDNMLTELKTKIDEYISNHHYQQPLQLIETIKDLKQTLADQLDKKENKEDVSLIYQLNEKIQEEQTKLHQSLKK